MTYLICSLAFALGWGVGMTTAERRTGAKLAAALSDRDAAREALDNCRSDMNDFAERAAQWKRLAVQAEAALANRIARKSEGGRKAAATRKARQAVPHD